ncbi:hypothetical protein AAC387_Pa01g4429 [Persea americana]
MSLPLSLQPISLSRASLDSPAEASLSLSRPSSLNSAALVSQLGAITVNSPKARFITESHCCNSPKARFPLLLLPISSLSLSQLGSSPFAATLISSCLSLPGVIYSRCNSTLSLSRNSR